MLLHIGENIWLDSDEISMVLNVNSAFEPGNQTKLYAKKEYKLKDGEKVRSIILTKNDELYESLIDSKTLFKRDNVLGFLNSPWRKHE